MTTQARRDFLAKGSALAVLASIGASNSAQAQDTPAITPNPEALQKFLSAPDDGPIVMLNLLRFKPDGGRAEYMTYGQKVQPLLEKAGAKQIYVGTGLAALVSDDEWDMIALVMYPSKQAFIGMVNSPEYQAIHHHRNAGLEKTVLYATKPLGSL